MYNEFAGKVNAKEEGRLSCLFFAAKDSHRLDSTGAFTGTSLCSQAIEPLSAKPDERWLTMAANRFAGILLPNHLVNVGRACTGSAAAGNAALNISSFNENAHDGLLSKVILKRSRVLIGSNCLNVCDQVFFDLLAFQTAVCDRFSLSALIRTSAEARRQKTALQALRIQRPEQREFFV